MLGTPVHAATKARGSPRTVEGGNLSLAPKATRTPQQSFPSRIVANRRCTIPLRASKAQVAVGLQTLCCRAQKMRYLFRVLALLMS